VHARVYASVMSRTHVTDEQRRELHLLLQHNVALRPAAKAVGISASYASEISKQPFSNDRPATLPSTPAQNFQTDQPPVPDVDFRPGYHDHTYQAFSAPIGFEGWDLARVRRAISAHRNGIFLESSVLASVVVGFGPVLAALGQRVAPLLALPRQIKSGHRGLSRILGAELERQLVPRDGLMPSEHFPPTVYGSVAIDLAMGGFAVLQHAYGDPDPDTGVRPIYTRRWPQWATVFYEYRRTFVAQTTEGPVDIVSGDGKFTLIGDSERPHLYGAIVPLGEEALDGRTTQRSRAGYINKYGNPKWIGTLPPQVSVQSPEGKEFFAAIKTVRGPDGVVALPAGSQFKIDGLTSGQSSAFQDALSSNWQYIAAILLGSDGTMSKDSGPYSAPIFKGVRRDLIDRDRHATVRGINAGHIGPWLRFNYAQSIAVATGWVDPVIDIPLPDPDREARIKSYGERVLLFHQIVKAERESGFEITQDRAEQIAMSLEIETPTLQVQSESVVPLQLAPTDVAKVVFVDEARRSQGLPGIGDERGKLTITELEGGKSSEENDDASTDDAESDEGDYDPVPPDAPDRAIDAMSGVRAGNVDALGIELCTSCKAAWDESKHPRKGGKFAPKGSGGDSGKKDEGKSGKGKKDEKPESSKKTPAKKAVPKRKTAKKVAKKKTPAKKPTPKPESAKKTTAKKAVPKRKTAKKVAKKTAEKKRTAKQTEAQKKAKEASKAKAAAARKKVAEEKRAKSGAERTSKKTPTKQEGSPKDSESKPEKRKIDPSRYDDIRDTPTLKQEYGQKKEHTPEHWESEYSHLGSGAKHAAVGRAIQERGLDMHPDEVESHLGHLTSEDTGIASVRGMIEIMGNLRKGGDFSSVREMAAKYPAMRGIVHSVAALAAHVRELKGDTMDVDIEVDESATDWHVNEIKKASLFYASVSRGGNKFGNVYVSAKKTDDGRPVYIPKSGVAGYDKKNAIYGIGSGFTQLTVHELGHCLEEQNEHIRDAVYNYLDTRTKGETAKRLNDVHPTLAGQFSNDEKTKKDEFMDPYMGKEYKLNGNRYACEVTSVALEHMYLMPDMVMRKDPELFHFMLGVLAARKS